MNRLYTELQWLPRPPVDFSERTRVLQPSSGQFGKDIQALSLHALNVNQLTKLAKAIGTARISGISLEPLTPLRLAVLSNATIDLIVPALVATGVRHGLALDVVHSSFGQVAQEAFASDSKVNSSGPDAVLFVLDYRALPLELSLGGSSESAAIVSGVISYLRELRDAIKRNSNAICIFQTFAPPVETLFGSMDCALPGTRRSLINSVNVESVKLFQDSGDVIVDVAGLAQTVGLADWHDSRLWNLGKFPFGEELIPLYCDYVARTVAALRGKSRKALVLDLDNTIWGGVIGDEGLDGIKLAQGDPHGEAFLAVQRLALDLRQRGIVLAVCSKNADEIAREPFTTHAEMLLSLDHIAVFRANWNDKATNIQAIAEELSVGLDSLVFLDDNPVERGLVRKLLPQVAVPELPDDPAWYPRTIAAAGYFESVTFANEDLTRAAYYQDNAKRVSLQRKVGDVDAYLASLEMTVTFQPFDKAGRARITQLINKSNQYNLTTRRYSESDVADAENEPNVLTLQVRLADIFGDNGMISVIICRPTAEDGVWEVDTWLMSCRVLGRKVEHMVLRELFRHARAAGIRKLVGVYLPTGRNKLVADHYLKLGFTKLEEQDSGLTRWFMAVDGPEPESALMKVISHGFTSQRDSYEVVG